MCYTIFSPTQIETTKIVPPDLKKKKKSMFWSRIQMFHLGNLISEAIYI